MKRKVAPLVAAAALVTTPFARAQEVQTVVLRNSFDPRGSGARGLGMGGAFIAVADDGTAASFNPAGLAQLRRTEVALVGFTDKLTSSVTVPRREGDETTSQSIQHSAPDFLGVAIPFETLGHNLTVQLSYQRAVDLFGQGSVTLIQNGSLDDIDPGLPPLSADFSERVTPEQSGAFHTLSVSVGYQVTSRLSLGASVNYWFGDWTARGNIDFRLLVPRPGSEAPLEMRLFDVEFNQQQSLRAFNLNLGFLLKYPHLSVGGVTRLPFSGNYKLRERDTATDFLNRDEAGNPTPTPTEFEVASQLRWPRSAGVGAAFRPFRGLTLAAEYTRSQWSRALISDVPGGALLTDRDPVDGAGNPIPTFTNRNFFDLESAAKSVTRDTSEWRGGAEYLVLAHKLVVPLRVGIFRDHFPIIDFATRKGRTIRGWTAGTGINLKHLVLDLAFERRRSDGTVGLRLNRQGAPAGEPTAESVSENRLVASLIYRAGDDDAIKRALRFLFVGSKEEGAGKN